MTAPDPSTCVQSCPVCRNLLPWENVGANQERACPSCSTRIEATVFPALFRGSGDGQGATPVLADGEAGCFDHPGRKAVVTCSVCGRFLCALCDVLIASRHICPACIRTGKQKGHLQILCTHRVLYDEVVLSLAAISLLVWPFALVAIPAALFVAARHWNDPLSIVRPSRVRMTVGVSLAVLAAIPCALALFFLSRAVISS